MVYNYAPQGSLKLGLIMGTLRKKVDRAIADLTINLGIFTDFDIAMEAIKKEYGDFEESDDYIQKHMQMTPLNNPNDVKIGIDEVELNILEEI